MTSIRSTHHGPYLQLSESNLLRERANTMRSMQNLPKKATSLRKNRHMSIPLKENTPKSPVFTPRNQEHFEPVVRPSQQSMKTDLQSTQSDLHTKPNLTDSSDSLTTPNMTRQLGLIGTFAEASRIFTFQAGKMKMSVSDTTESSVTVRKTGRTDSCHCLLRLWQPSKTSSAVYQLQAYQQSKRVKIILVEGAQAQFGAFCSKVMRQGTDKNVFKLGLKETVELFVEEHGSQAVDKIRRQVEKIMKKSRRDDTTDSAEFVLQKVKILYDKLMDRLKSLPASSKNSHHLSFNFSTALERHLFTTTRIPSLFCDLYTEEEKLYQVNRSSLLSRLDIDDIFDHLQLQDHLANFNRRREQLRKQGHGHSVGELPYLPALKCLQSMQGTDSPSELLEKVLLFQEKINFCHSEYFGRGKLAGMDDYLPLSIFCVLVTDCSQRKLIGAMKMLQSWLTEQDEYEEERKIVTNLEAGLEYVWRQWKE